MQRDFGVLGQELLHGFGLMGRKIIGDEMDAPLRRLRSDDLLEKSHKLALVWRSAVLPKTALRVSSAA